LGGLYIQEANGRHYTLERAELMALLKAQSNDNPDQIDLEQAITEMGRAGDPYRPDGFLGACRT
jgi:hypothetical protein